MSVSDDKKERYTTLLQAGIVLESTAGKALGVFLNELPEFDTDYLSDRVQTIFLDGSAIDDLERCFSEAQHIVALSAAMPGLAGAIFRRNSLCAALRTRKDETDTSPATKDSIRITVKLFNAIAQEKGMQLLSRGGIFSGETLRDFFHPRPSLLQGIHSLEFDDEAIEADTLTSRLRVDEEYYLTITTNGQKQ